MVGDDLVDHDQQSPIQSARRARRRSSNRPYDTSACILFAAAWLTIPTTSIALDGHQWQQLVPEGKVLYVTGVLESWMHETTLAERLNQRAPESASTLGTTFQTFIPCLRAKK